MKRYSRQIILLLLFFITKLSYGMAAKDSIAVVRIDAKEYKNKTVKIFNAMGLPIDTIKLSSNGDGMASISIVKRQFFRLIVEGNKTDFPFYFEPGCNNLDLHIEKESYYYKGKGSALNNYLLKTNSLLAQFDDSVYDIKEPISGIEKVIHFSNQVESEHARIYKVYCDSISPSKEMKYLLNANVKASLLRAKEDFLSYFEKKQIDSLQLESRLGLADNSLLQDTLLIQHPSLKFYMYLEGNRDKFLINSFGYMVQDSGLTLWIHGIESAKQYSAGVKEYLLFSILFMDVTVNGPKPFTDSIMDRLKKQHRVPSEYQKLFLVRKKEFAGLMPGKMAPPLQGISPEGKVYSLNDFKGKVIFVDIWATWCSPCIEGLPHVLELKKKFESDKDVVFIFIANNKEEPWEKYLAEHPDFTGVHLRARTEVEYLYYKAWKGGGIPRYMLIDKQGRIIDAFAKNNSYEKLKTMIENALLK